MSEQEAAGLYRVAQCIVPLEARFGGRSNGKQSVLLRKKPRSAAGLTSSRLRSQPSLVFIFLMPQLRQRSAPRSAKAQFTHDATIQLRRRKRAVAQLTEQARVTGYSRSAIIGRRLSKVRRSCRPRRPRAAERYRQLISNTNL
jgi:hypothetical protein